MTNAIQHTTTQQVGVQIAAVPSGIRVSVTDDSREPPRPGAADQGTTAQGGRGLGIVAALSDATGHHPGPRTGKIVWFELHHQE